MLKAIRDTVIVKKQYQEKAGNIIIPKAANKFKLYDGDILYTVVSVGPEFPYPLKAGDSVIIQRHEGKAFIYENEQYFTMRKRWIAGVISS
jgi:co-chaperonin GroES (HSP10)